MILSSVFLCSLTHLLYLVLQRTPEGGWSGSGQTVRLIPLCTSWFWAGRTGA